LSPFTVMSKVATALSSPSSLVSLSLAPSMSSMSSIADWTLESASAQVMSRSALLSLSSAAFTRSSTNASSPLSGFADDDGLPPPPALFLSSLRKKPGATKPVMPRPPSTRTTMATIATIMPVFFFCGGPP
jgi:hypothetical protein